MKSRSTILPDQKIPPPRSLKLQFTSVASIDNVNILTYQPGTGISQALASMVCCEKSDIAITTKPLNLQFERVYSKAYAYQETSDRLSARHIFILVGTAVSL
jgi:hypothetical protein